jgi:hypothetical protein
MPHATSNPEIGKRDAESINPNPAAEMLRRASNMKAGLKPQELC